MAYVLVYSQNFAAGDSLFTNTAFYSRDPAEIGVETASGDDPLYPDIRQAETVDVNIGGPGGGAKVLDGLGADYDGGAWFNTPTYADRVPGFSIPRGAAEVWYKPNSASLAWGTYHRLLNLQQNENNSGVGSLSLDVYQTGGQRVLRLRVLQTFGLTDHDPIHTLGTDAAIVDQAVVFRLEWSNGTLECEPEQYVRVLVNGAQVFALTSTVDGLELHANTIIIRGAVLGFAGLFGETTNLRIYDNPCDDGGGSPPPEPGPIPDDVGKVCPCKTGDGDGTGTPPAVLPVLQPWSPECIGGGLVPLAAAPSIAELW